MKFSKTFTVCFTFLVWHHVLSDNALVQACTFYVINQCPFPIWPATAPNVGHPVLAKGGFFLASGHTRKFKAPGDWSGRIWARTGCNFDSSNLLPACVTGDCDGLLECDGKIGRPPATLVEFTLQTDRCKPSFYDVSLVDGHNLPVSVSAVPSQPKCSIGGCLKDIKSLCPEELKVLNNKGQVVACKSACLAFDVDRFCCRNDYGSPARCKPTFYSNLFKKACPSYVSYAFDSPAPLVNCPSDEYLITFCPEKWGSPLTSSSYK